MARADAGLSAHDLIPSSGQPLDAATRSFMEPRFGHDFSRVRVHSDAEAAAAARAVAARAYTVGSDVVFAQGQYQPRQEPGRRLIAHELAHVVQQRHATAVSTPASWRIGAPDAPAEREAEAAAAAVVGSGMAPGPLGAAPSAPMLQRQPDKPDVLSDRAERLQQLEASRMKGPPNTSQVLVEHTGSMQASWLAQGKGGSGAVVHDYPARALNPPADKDGEKDGSSYEIRLPLLLYPPPRIDAPEGYSPKVDVFVFFHGMRATYQEEAKSQGSETIGLWTQLKEAVAGTDRLGIAPQAPHTWRCAGKSRSTIRTTPGKKKTSRWWEEATAQWNQALAKLGFDGLVNLALADLSKDLGLDKPLTPGDIHVWRVTAPAAWVSSRPPASAEAPRPWVTRCRTSPCRTPDTAGAGISRWTGSWTAAQARRSAS